MAAYSSAAFPLFVALCYVLGQLRSPVPRTTWFGVLNAIAVGFLFGHRSLLLLLVLSLVLWSALFVVIRMKNGPFARWVGFAGLALYAVATVVFVMHKALLEPGNDFSGFPVIAGLSRYATAPPVHTGLQALQIIAFSYIFLRLIDLTRSVLDGAKLLDPLAISGYLVPFFMTPSGPINIYADHVKMDETTAVPVTVAHFIDSGFLIVCGYFLKFVVAQAFNIFALGLYDQWPTGSIGGTAIFLFYILLEFTGYSLIALGIGNLLSIPTPVNFKHPYLATTVGDFWNRWHMSLGQFVRRNLYIPVQVALVRRFGRKNREAAYLSNVLALSLPFIFVGIWHRFSWSFLIWGVCLAVIVAVEKIVIERIIPRFKPTSNWPMWLTMPVGIIYTLTIVIITLHIASGDFIR